MLATETNKQILIVDRDVAAVEPLRQRLGEAGFIVRAITDGSHGRLLNLRGVEYRLLEFLMSHPGRTFNRTQLLAQVWGDDSEVDERTVDVNVQRLRKILAEPGYEAYIQTVRGFGYRFATPSPGRSE